MPEFNVKVITEIKDNGFHIVMMFAIYNMKGAGDVLAGLASCGHLRVWISDSSAAVFRS